MICWISKNNLAIMIQQTNLFNTDPQVAGFKLDYMEIWNWGTFNDKVYRLNPQGNNSLLTGANASGKSTLIDALLTLLVPRKKETERTLHISLEIMVNNKKEIQALRH